MVTFNSYTLTNLLFFTFMLHKEQEIRRTIDHLNYPNDVVPTSQLSRTYSASYTYRTREFIYDTLFSQIS